jgi:uncharacterized protein YegP (UPF0339 family)
MAKFVVYKDAAGWYRWRLVASNGEKVAASEAYASKANAARSAKRVREIASSATVVDAEQEAVRSVLAKLISKR